MIKINDEYKIIIVENTINKSIKKDLLFYNDLFNILNINYFINIVNNQFNKIKIVKNIKYNHNIVYEHKIVINKHESVRIAYAINQQNKIIYIIGIIKLDSKMTKFIFDKMIAKIC